MNLHIHSARSLFGWALVMAVVLPTIALSSAFAFSAPRAGLASVTGRVNRDGHPLGDVLICFDSAGSHSAPAWVRPDGSFRLYTFGRGVGAAQGKYRVHFATKPNGPSLPSQYRDPGTSGLDVEVGPGWNHFSFNLP
jgi:hypothetical protein